MPVTARPSGVVLKYVLPAVAMWKAPHCSAISPSRTSSGRQSTRRACSAPYCVGPRRNAGEVGLVVLAEVGGVGVRDGAAGAHPGDGRRRVEPAGEGDADALADGRDNRMRRLPSFTSSEVTGRSASRPVATGESGDREQRTGGGDRQLDDREAGDPGQIEHGDDGEDAAAARPAHGSQRELLSASRTIASGATNGSIVTNAGCGSPSGPSHHVVRPSSWLVFHTAT